MIEHAALIAIAAPILGAFATPMVGTLKGKWKDFFALAVVLIACMAVIALAVQVYANGPVVYTMGADAPLPSGYSVPVRIVLEIDAMSIIMAAIASVVSVVAVVSSFSFFKKNEKGMEKYYTLLLLMLGGMYGMIFTGDLFNLFVFLEILSIASCGLVAFWVHRGEASEAAFKYLVVSAVAGLFVLVAAALLYGQYNALNIAAIASVIQFGLVEKVAVGLLVAGLAMKAGSVPMHMWVPDAYGEAPAPVTVMLIAASLVSLYALFRVAFTLLGPSVTGVLGWAVIVLGVVSMFVGVTMAILQDDVKRLIAYQGVSQTGYIFLGLGVGLVVLSDPGAMSAYGLKAMAGSLFQMVNHVLYEGLLFLVAGAVLYRVGTRSMDELGGLAHRMPITAAMFVLGALAISGVPPLNGFASKFLIYESVYQFSPVLSIIAMVVALLTLASFAKVFHAVFLGPAKEEHHRVREVPGLMLLGMGILAVLIIAFSLFPDVVVSSIIEPAVSALVNQPQYVSAAMGVPGC